MSDVMECPFKADRKAFRLKLEFEAAEAVVDLANFFEQALVKTQCYEDESSARLWEERDISPEDEAALLPLFCESVHATWLHNKHASDEAATAAWFVAQGYR